VRLYRAGEHRLGGRLAQVPVDHHAHVAHEGPSHFRDPQHGPVRGHEDIRTTLIYTKVSGSDLKKVKSPLDNR